MADPKKRILEELANWLIKHGVFAEKPVTKRVLQEFNKVKDEVKADVKKAYKSHILAQESLDQFQRDNANKMLFTQEGKIVKVRPDKGEYGSQLIKTKNIREVNAQAAKKIWEDSSKVLQHIEKLFSEDKVRTLSKIPDKKLTIQSQLTPEEIQKLPLEELLTYGVYGKPKSDKPNVAINSFIENYKKSLYGDTNKGKKK